MPIKTRFAPSPTGDIHLGNLRTAIFNYLYARAKGGQFLIRVEDTDKARSKSAYVDGLLRDLAWLGITWDEGPYFQSARDEVYESYYARLQAEGWVYPCYCTEMELTMQRKAQMAAGQAPRYPGTCRHLTVEAQQEKARAGIVPNLRFRVPTGRMIRFTDLVYGPKQFESDDLGDFVVRKADGGPTFIFCNAIDDALMGVTHALRGEDHLTNTPRQQLLLEVLGLPVPLYAHLPIILGADGKPLSKRNGSQSIIYLHEQGYLPAAIVNYVARLGHHDSTDALSTLDALAARFDLTHIATAPAHFDVQHLDFWQKTAVMATEETVLADWIAPALSQVPEDKKPLFLSRMRENVRFPQEALLWAQRYFAEELPCEPVAQLSIVEAGQDFFQAVLAALLAEGLDAKRVIQALEVKTGKKGKAIFAPLRSALTGTEHGLALSEVFAMMGLSRVQQRIHAAIARCA